MKKTVYTYIFQEQKSQLVDGQVESWVDTYQVKAEGVRQAYKKVPTSAILIEVEDRAGNILTTYKPHKPFTPAKIQRERKC